MTQSDDTMLAALMSGEPAGPDPRLCIETMQSWLDGKPVWPCSKIIEVWGREFMDIRRQWRELAERMLAVGSVSLERRVRRETALFHVRMEYVARYGFAIPCAELIDALREAQPIVEVGAGSGYMTKLMRNAGIDVIGSDIDEGRENSGHGFIVGEHDPMQIGRAAAKQVVRRFPDRAVFCSWPTLKATWFRQMLRAMRLGQELIVIREECCAEDSAWQYIDDCFEHRRDIELPCFPMIHDYAGLYVKRRQDVQSKDRSPVLGGRRRLSRRRASRNPKRLSKAA